LDKLFASIMEQDAKRTHGGWASGRVKRTQGSCQRTQFVSPGALHVADNIDAHRSEIGNSNGNLRVAVLLLERAQDEALHFTERKAGKLNRSGIRQKNASVLADGANDSSGETAP